MTTLLLDIALKASVLLLLALAVTWPARRSAAAQRHFVWTLVLTGLLALPVLSTLVPWRLSVLPARVERLADDGWRMAAGNEVPSGLPPSAIHQPPSAGAPEPSAAIHRPPSAVQPWTLERTLLAVWGLGVALLLLRLAFSVGAALWLLRGGREVRDPSWHMALADAADQLGVRTPVRLLETSRARVPMTFGVQQPVIVLPEEAGSWTADARRIVLLHELAHIRRGDVVTNLLGQLACALYWFHPLVWDAARRLRIEAEQACDDLVLHAGAAPSTYAEQLLTIVQAAGRSPAPLLAVPMAQPSAFEGRIIAILQPGRERHQLTRRATAMGVLALLAVAVPLAALSPRDGGTEGPGDRETELLVAGIPEVSEPAENPSPRPAVPRSPVAQDPSLSPPVPLSPVSQGLIAALQDTDAGVRAAAVQALGERADTAAINALLEALRRDTSREVRRMAAWALGEIEDPRAVRGLVAALREERDREVRLAIVHALGEIESPDAVEGLGSALRSETDSEIRQQMVWALGEIESPDAVPFLTRMLRDADGEVRRQVAWALGEIEAPSAVEALAAALTDETVQAIREQIVWALGEIEDLRASPALELALRDASVEVRRKAVWALGELDGLRSAPAGLLAALRDADLEIRRAAVQAVSELEDPAAVPALIGLLRDPDLEVRRAAVMALGEIRSVAAAEALVGMLRDEDPEIRRLAAQALGNR